MLDGTCGGSDEQSRAELAAAETRVTQDMIDVSADRLEGLRTQCATSAELTQHEIRTLEGKLMKLFSRQLVAKTLFDERLKHEFRNVPRLSQWLRVVGLSPESVQAVCARIGSVEALKEASEHELRALLRAAREEEVRRLCRAMFILKKYTDALLREEYAAGDGPSMQLYWDSWDRHHLRGGSPRARTRHQRASVPSEDALSSATPGGGKLATTPVTSRRERGNNLAAHEPQPLTKSRSHESQLAAPAPTRHAADITDNGQPATGGGDGGGGDRSPPPSPARDPLPPAPHPSEDHTPHHHPRPSLPNNSGGGAGAGGPAAAAPRSPRTPVARGMAHDIAHRFAKTFNMIATCDLCDKQMLFGAGLKCKECKFKCHRECESKVPPSCGLPPEFVTAFKEQLQNHGPGYPSLGSHSPVAARGGGGAGGGSPAHSFLGALAHNRPRKRARHQPNASPFTGGPDSSSASSCNSSSPSSPALVGAAPAAGAPGTPRTPHHHQHAKPQFHFPEVKSSSAGTAVAATGAGVGAASPVRHPPHHDRHEELAASGRSVESSRAASLSGSASTDSDRAARAGSLEEAGAAAQPDDARWPRQNSLSMKEWDIPYDELRLYEPLGTGRFGTVYSGSWHGAVAVKLLNVQYLHDDGGALDNFKHEVATFRKTRHENLVLFMGACMKPPKLAIVTSMCKGLPLYALIHVHKDKFTANKSSSIALQITQGMGYLHARGIVHKDLRSKNIFLESGGKVVITDFGLFSVTKLCFGNNARGDSLGIPPGWLCYLAPELVRSLRPHASVHLPFSKASDVYAFGSVWYEILCGEWPFTGQPPEAVIWQVGKGIKQTLSTLQASRDIKDILMLCWSYRASERPDFARLLSTLEHMPRKRLARSPSHPVHLSRSAESVF